MPSTVVRVQTDADQEKVYQFRYRIYVEELGYSPPGADHARKRLTDELDPYSRSYALIQDGNLVGCVRATVLAELPDPTPLVVKFRMEPALATFGISGICTTSRFMFDTKHRGRKGMVQLMEAAYRDARERNIRLNYGDCDPALLSFYRHLGYRPCGPPFCDPHHGLKVPILMLLGDQEYFAQVRSPLARIASEFPDDAVARGWLNERPVQVQL